MLPAFLQWCGPTMSKWAVFFLLAIAPSAKATPIQVQVVAYQGDGAMLPSDIYRTLGGVREDFEKAGVDVRFQRIWFTRFDPCSHLRTLHDFPSRVYGCYRLQAPRYRSRYGPVLVIAPPLRDGTSNNRWLAGVSGQCRGRVGDRVSIAFITPQTYEGVDRRYPARIVVSHEIGHALGANHTGTGADIMSTMASMFAREMTSGLMFNEQSKQEMRSCLTRR